MCIRDSEEVYSIEMDPGPEHYYYNRRHYREGGIAFVEMDRAGVKRATWLPIYMDPHGQPSILQPADPQFESSRRYLEWVSQKLKCGVQKIDTSDGHYVLYER